MRPSARWLLVTLAVGAFALGAAVAVNAAWQDRAKDVCRDDAPQLTSTDSVTWDWSELAYVCNYRAPNAKPKRVGIIDAFHSDERRRHGG